MYSFASIPSYCRTNTRVIFFLSSSILNFDFLASKNNRDQSASPQQRRTWRMTSVSTCPSPCRINWLMSSKRTKPKRDANRAAQPKASHWTLSTMRRNSSRRPKSKPRQIGKKFPRETQQVIGTNISRYKCRSLLWSIIEIRKTARKTP